MLASASHTGICFVAYCFFMCIMIMCIFYITNKVLNMHKLASRTTVCGCLEFDTRYSFGAPHLAQPRWLAHVFTAHCRKIAYLRRILLFLAKKWQITGIEI